MIAKRTSPMQRQYASLFADVADGAAVVAASRRLARALQLGYAQWCMDRGHVVWSTPRIVTADGWFGGLWNVSAELNLCGLETSLPRRCLSAHQERALWERVIADCVPDDHFLNIAAAADLAMDAWRLAQQWNLLPSHWRGDVSEDCRAFAEWAQRFEQRLDAADSVTQVQLPNLLTAQLSQLRAHLPSRVMWAGFDVMPSQWNTFAAALQQHGVSSTRYASPPSESTAVRVSFPDSRAELYAAARWARAQLERDDQATVAVVVVDVEQRRHDVMRIFTDVLAPQDATVEHPGANVFNVSLGTPLLDAPMIQDAVALLEGMMGPISSATFGRLLLSPYCGTQANEGAELGMRAEWDRCLRERGEEQVKLAQASALLPSNEPAPAFAAQVEALAALSVMPSTVKPWRQWIEFIDAVLTQAGWPGPRQRSSADMQLHAAWIEVLEALAEFEAVLPAPRFSEVVAQLRRLAADHMFQPESPPAPVQIVGSAQAAGLYFDALWVAGCHDEALPPPPRTSPLLPLALQRAAGVPHASSATVLARTQVQIDAWRAAAAHVIFSHAYAESDRELQLSPLLRDVIATTHDALDCSSAPLWAEHIRTELRTEPRPSSSLPLPVTTARWSGGVSLFQDQSACPFRAFARQRLGARPIRAYRNGWEGHERGSIVHSALAHVWAEFPDSRQLQGVSDAELQRSVERAARRAVRAAAQQRPLWFNSLFTDLEVRRLARGLFVWLRTEQAREPFCVEEIERGYTMTIGPVTVDGRIDRVDRLSDGSHVVLDYKTGKTDVKHWFTPRLQEPQLPLYAVAAVNDVSALAYVEVNARGLKFNGLAADVAWAQGIKPFGATKFSYGGTRSWAEQLHEWQQHLTALAQEFADGRHEVAPRDGLDTCRYCDQHVLCRIYEQNVHETVEDESSEDESDE